MKVSLILAVSLFSLVQNILCESESQSRNDNVDDIDRILQNRFPMCHDHTRCVGIQGMCCPTQDGIMLDCCGTAIPVPLDPPIPAPLLPTVPSPRAISGPTILVMLPPVVSSRCSSHAKCTNLDGDCCPNAAGKFLDCCTTRPTAPVPAPVSSNTCSSNPKCAILNLEGDCCPTTDGFFLNCCRLSNPPVAPVPSPRAISKPTLLIVLPPVVSSRCSSHPKCASLDGDCCPNAAGKFLDCCVTKGPAPVPVQAPFSAPVVSAKCSLNTKCAALNLGGNCCPSNDGKFLDCCDSKSQPTPVAVPAPTPAKPTLTKPTWISPKCSANVRCKNQGLTGNCCPTAQGNYLDCCKHTSSPQCSKNPICASQGLKGNCCPTGEGVFLSCCKK